MSHSFTQYSRTYVQCTKCLKLVKSTLKSQHDCRAYNKSKTKKKASYDACDVDRFVTCLEKSSLV